MTPTSYLRLIPTVLSTLGIAAALSALGSAATPRFLPDDPIWVERDTQDASSMKPDEVNLFVDLTYNFLAASKPSNSRALNVNTVDEVPDSSWFTNRAGRRALTPLEVAVGPDRTNGPAPGAWTVTSSKTDGVTPGFTIKDAAGQRWFLKFDPPGHRGMSTGTEVAVTKLMWALGYNVPENHIAYVRREQFVLGKNTTFAPAGAKPRAMHTSDVDELLRRAEEEPDGSYRVVASKALDGKPIGRIRFRDSRPDDPNDVVAHEDRRELRGYGVFAAWLNHVDAKAINSLDMLVTENGRSFVRHNLIDFGSALGSGGVAPADYWAGTQYLLQPGNAGRQMVGFGFLFPTWHTEKFYESSSIGRIPARNTNFNPEQWKPRVPNQAFIEARADDNFWAAQKLVALTTDILRAAVDTGDFGDRASEDVLVKALAERRDAIVRTYMTAINPISDPSLSADGTLTFRNAAVDADLAKAPEGYRATWSTFDNATGAGALIGETKSPTTQISAPAPLPQAPGAFVRVEVSAIGGRIQPWKVPVQAYFERLDTSWRLVGFQRLPDVQ